MCIQQGAPLLEVQMEETVQTYESYVMISNLNKTLNVQCE